MIITISGMPGSGKSTVARKIAEKLNLKVYSGGDMRGKLAMERGITIDELNKLGEKDEWTDKEVDNYIKKIAKKEDNFILDSWIGYYLIPDSFKVFLDVDEAKGAERIFKEQRKDEEKKDNAKEVEDMIKKRINDCKKRYKRYYGIEFPDKEKCDLVIDTTNISAEEVADKILNAVKEKRL